MRPDTALATLTLLSAALLATTAFAQAPAAPPATGAPGAAPPGAAPAAPVKEDAKAQTFATLPTADTTEEMCQQTDGTLYVTIIHQHKIDKVTADGRVSDFAGAPNMAEFVGIGWGDNQIVVNAFEKSFRGAPATATTPAGLAHFNDVNTHVIV